MAHDKLTSADHQNMEAFLGAVLDDYRDGQLAKAQAVGGLAHVMAALNLGNVDEARNWFTQGRKFIRDGA